MKLLVALVVCAHVAHAAPVCRLAGRPWLEGRLRGAAGTRATPSRAVDARFGEAIEIFLAAPGRLDGRAVVFGEAGAHRISWSKTGCPAAQIAWARVEPRAQHTATPAPNPEFPVYSNAVVFGPKHGQWIGFDRIEYFETPLEGAGWTLRARDATPTGAPAGARDGIQQSLGVMRLKATLSSGGVTVTTPGAADAREGQIGPEVFRYTFRDGDGFLGWLTSFFNVPYLFGSAGKGERSQAERYVGADCADILVAALRRAGVRDRRGRPFEYSSVADLVDSLKPVAGPVEIAACQTAPCAASTLRFGRDVRPGDLLALDYVGADELPRPWDHIVAVVEDDGPDGEPDGLLGPDDLVADSGSADGLKFATLAQQGHVRVVVLRPR